MKILFRDCFELNSVYLIGTSRAFIVFRTINSDIYRYIGFDSNAFSELKVTEWMLSWSIWRNLKKQLWFFFCCCLRIISDPLEISDDKTSNESYKIICPIIRIWSNLRNKCEQKKRKKKMCFYIVFEVCEHKTKSELYYHMYVIENEKFINANAPFDLHNVCVCQE